MKFFLTLLLTAIIGNGYAQTNSELKDFSSSVGSLVARLEMNVRECHSFMTIMKLGVDSTGVKEIVFSDSADSIFAVAAMNKIKNMDVKSLLRYLKQNNLASCTFLMPISYRVISEGCLNPMIDNRQVLNYSKFKGLYFSGKCVWIQPCNFEVVI
jgi:hypothetical protein